MGCARLGLDRKLTRGVLRAQFAVIGGAGLLAVYPASTQWAVCQTA
jgi:hypothetical protein